MTTWTKELSTGTTSTSSSTSTINGALTVGEDTSITGDLTVTGGAIVHKQLGGSDYQPAIQLYNYDDENSSSTGFSQIQFFNSKSDTETNVVTDADAHLGRILWYGNGGAGGTKFAAHIACRQTSSWSASNDSGYVGSQLNFTGVAQKADGSTGTANLSWAPPATPHASSGLNLVVGGNSASITQPLSNQVMIGNGTSGTAINNFIAIGSKNIGGDTALELTQEEAIVSEAVTSDRTLQVTINGAIYKLLLDYVSGE